MSTTEHDQRARRGEDALQLIDAANQEALRAGHAEVDSDHLLLGLLVVDGPAAAVLRDLGIGLAQARDAAAGVAEDDLQPLREDPTTAGVLDRQASAWPELPAPPRPGLAWLPATGRARLAGAPLGRRAPDTEVLQLLLSDPHGPAGRVLARLGVDVAQVRAGLAAGAVGPAITTAPAGDATTANQGTDARGADAGPGERWTTSVSTTVAVEPSRLWALLTDDSRRPTWDTEVAAVEPIDDTTFDAVPPLVVDDPVRAASAGIADLRTTYRRTSLVEGEHVQWQIDYPGRGRLLRRGRVPRTERLRIELAPAPAGTTVTVRHQDPEPTGPLSRLAARAAGLGQRGRLLDLARALAQAA